MEGHNEFRYDLWYLCAFFILCAKANFAQYDGLTCHPEQIPPRFSAGCAEVLRNEAC